MKKKLDLHGIKHIDADNIIEDYILITKPPFSIITGNSIDLFFIIKKTTRKSGFFY